MQVAEHVDPALIRDFDYHGGAEFLVDPFQALDRARGDRAFFSTSYGGYWVLTRFADIREAFQRPDLFSSAQFSIPAGAYPRTMRPLALDPSFEYDRPFVFYYVRVTQANRQLAWSSPIWLTQR